jgi:drug/metabolite transporter (DMT)-like permease
MKVGFAVALAIAITGQVLYHVTQKSVASTVHPVASLVAFYVGAAVLSLPLFWFFPLTTSVGEELTKMNWAVWGVAGSIVLIELGFLLAYRAGGNLSTAFVLSAAVVTTSLLIVGVAFFREAFSLTKIAGIGLCLAGIWLISSKTN